jgi:dynein heavy chain
MNDPLEAINAEEVEKNVGDAYKTMHKSNKVFQEMPGLKIRSSQPQVTERFKVLNKLA